MAKIYFEKLTRLMTDLEIEKQVDVQLEVKHFFSGAALYANEVICISWSPAGLAFKLPESEVIELISCGKASPLRYFAKGHVKKGYVAFENPEVENNSENNSHWEEYFLKAIEQVT
jgi:hypothetical protein